MKYLLMILGFSIVTFSFAQQWTEIALPENSGANDIHFFNSDTAILIAQNNFSIPHTYRTTDAGQTWDSIHLDYSSWLLSSFFVSDEVGYLGGGAVFASPPNYPSDLILKTTDGGLTFDSLYADYSGASITDIAFADTDNGVFTGEYYTLSTTDGGQTIETLSFSSFYNPTQVEFPDLQHLYLFTGQYLGSNMYDYFVLKSADIGQTWDTIPLGSYSNSVGKMQFLDADRGYIVGNNGRFIQTEDGNTFTSMVVDTGIHFTDVQFLDENIGFVCAFSPSNFGGYLYSTIDGGATWSQELIDTNFAVQNINIIDDKIYAHNSVKLFVTERDSFITTGVRDRINHSLRLYPNPSQDFVQIDIPFEIEDELSFKIIDISGKIVKEEVLTSKNQVVDISTLSVGSYCGTVDDGVKPIAFTRLLKE